METIELEDDDLGGIFASDQEDIYEADADEMSMSDELRSFNQIETEELGLA